MKVLPLRPEQEKTYDALCAEHGGVFQTRQWAAAIGGEVELLGIHTDGGEMVGGMCLKWRRVAGLLRMATNPPLTPFVGPFCEVRATNPVAVHSFAKDLFEAVADYLASRSPLISAVTFDLRWRDMLPFVWRGYKVLPEYTYVIDLALDEKELLARMSNERRKNLRRADKDGLRVTQSNNLKLVRQQVADTFLRQGMSRHLGAVDGVLHSWAAGGDAFAYVAEQGGRALASALCVHDRRTAYYVLSGHVDEDGHHGAGASCMWACICHAKRLGIRTFDFEGAMIPRIERYVRGFGGELVARSRVVRALLPVEMALKVVRRAWF